RHTRSDRDWSSDVCSSDLVSVLGAGAVRRREATENTDAGTHHEALVAAAGDVDHVPLEACRAVDAVLDRLARCRRRAACRRVAEIGRASCRERGWGWVGGR